MTCNEFTFRTADIQEIFYFNSYDTDGARIGWDDPEKMVDGIMWGDDPIFYSVAYTNNSNQIQWCDGNSSPTNRSTTITKVEIRAYSNSVNSCGTLTAYLKPIFTTDGDAYSGDIHSWIPPGSDYPADVPPEWSVWFDITNDTNAPATWTWTDVNNLDVDHWMVRVVCGWNDMCRTARIEIRVTWYDSIMLSNPLPGSPDNKLNKQLKQFNLWEDYKLHDDGIAGQPLSFEGVEIGMPLMYYGVCFPICFPICFNKAVEEIKPATQMAQEKIEKIHDWMENHYNILLSEFGDCFDAEYAIKDFAVTSMNHPSNYAWKLTLEKV